MNVLITGGYGFIGSHVAEKFHNEGNKIFILDNLSRGSKSNIAFKHYEFIIDIRDSEVETIFKENEIDLVVHLAGQSDIHSSFKSPSEDLSANILGLVNILSIAAKYNVRKFILASSAAIYGEQEMMPIAEISDKNPISIHGINKYSGEYYVRKWNELYGINTLCLRISNVYGPRQRFDETGGVIPIFLSKAKNDDDIIIYGDGEQTRDFIYVGDVAEAIHRASKLEIKGIYNLSAMIEVSINDIIEHVRSIYDKEVRIIKTEERRGDIRRSCLDSSRVRTALDWSPAVTIEEGIQRTYEWVRDDPVYDDDGDKSSAKAVGSKADVTSGLRSMAIYAENIAGGVVATAVDIFAIKSVQFGIVDIRMLYIAVLSSIYGLKHGLVAIFLSIISVIGTRLYMGYDLASIFFNSEIYLAAAIYFITGLIIGNGRERTVKEKSLESEEVRVMEEKLSVLGSNYKNLIVVMKELQNQIINSEDSIGKIFSIVQEFNTLSSEDVFSRSVTVLERLLKTKGVAVFRVREGSDFARLVSMSEEMSMEVHKSIRLSENPELEAAVKSNNIFVSKTLMHGHPIMVMPVNDGTSVVGIVAIYKCEFERLTLAYQNFFKIVTLIMSAELSKAYAFERLKEDEKYVEGTLIIKESEFKKIYASKIQSSDSYHSDVCILRIRQDRPLKEISKIVHKTVRDLDSLGVSESGGLYLILGNTNRIESDFLISRLEQLGITAELVNGVI